MKSEKKCSYIMDIDIRTPNIDTVKTAPVSSSDSHVVRLAVCTSSHDEVEHRGIDKNDIVHGEVCSLLNAKQTSTVPLPIFVLLVSIAFPMSANPSFTIES